CIELAAGCPSTGWQYCLGHSHALAVGSFFEESVQDEVFADPDFICPMTARPQGALTERADGGWEFPGVFNYCSGAPYAWCFSGHALPAEGPKVPNLFVASRSQWTMLNDWGNQLGLKGTGSHSIQFDGAVLPARFVLPGTTVMSIDVSKG